MPPLYFSICGSCFQLWKPQSRKGTDKLERVEGKPGKLLKNLRESGSSNHKFSKAKVKNCVYSTHSSSQLGADQSRSLRSSVFLDLWKYVLPILSSFENDWYRHWCPFPDGTPHSWAAFCSRIITDHLSYPLPCNSHVLFTGIWNNQNMLSTGLKRFWAETFCFSYCTECQF